MSDVQQRQVRREVELEPEEIRFNLTPSEIDILRAASDAMHDWGFEASANDVSWYIAADGGDPHKPPVEFIQEFIVLVGNDTVEPQEVPQRLRWLQQRQERLRQAGARASRATAVEDLIEINLHRTHTGARALDPVAAGWRPEDVRAEAARIRRIRHWGS